MKLRKNHETTITIDNLSITSDNAILLLAFFSDVIHGLFIFKLVGFPEKIIDDLHICWYLRIEFAAMYCFICFEF